MVSKLGEAASKLLEQLSATLAQLPREICVLLRRMYNVLQSGKPTAFTSLSHGVSGANFDRVTLCATMGFLFARLFAPCISDPARFGIEVDSDSVEGKGYQALLATILQNIGTGQLFPKEDDDVFAPLNHLICDSQATLSEILWQILVSVALSLPHDPSIILTNLPRSPTITRRKPPPECWRLMCPSGKLQLPLSCTRAC